MASSETPLSIGSGIRDKFMIEQIKDTIRLNRPVSPLGSGNRSRFGVVFRDADVSDMFSQQVYWHTNKTLNTQNRDQKIFIE